MDKNLYFLTKPLVNEAIIEINKNGIPPKREGRGYAVSIGEEKYPFKLIVTEAAKISGVNLTSNDFSSSEANRNGFQKITGYPIINLGGEIEYFDLKQIAEYKNEVGKQYDSNSPGAKCYNDTRSKLQYLGRQLGELFRVDLINNYNEKPNKMAGQGKGFVQKEYILTGFIPKIYHEKGNQIFIKLIFARFSSEICFGIDIDVNFSDDNNPFNHNREALQNESQWTIKVDENFPTNWEDLLDVISPIFEKQLKILDTFFSQKATIMNLNNHLNILRYKKQIILQGPPGTGKTREAKLIAKEMLGLADVKDLKDNDQFKLIQFHPSYTYEDFVRGIVAKPNPDGEGIIYEAENKILGTFAKAALRSYKASSNISSESNIEIWIDSKFEDFKNEIEAKLPEEEIKLSGDITIFEVADSYFKYAKSWQTPGYLKFSEFKKIVKAILLGEFELSNKQLDKEKFIHAHYRYTYYNALLKIFFENYNYQGESYSEPSKNYVLIIDEINRANLSSVLGELIYALEYRGEAVESMYAIQDDKKLILPPNLYIIGTMNTADRSVGHIDYAIRRRFAFVNVLPKDLKIHDNLDDFDSNLFKNVAEFFIDQFNPKIDYHKESETKRSIYISNEFDPKDVWLGHSYFIQHYEKDVDGKEDKNKPIDFKLRLEYEIKPILQEYVKDGVLVGDGIQKKIQELTTSI